MNAFYLDGFGYIPEGRRQAYSFYRMVALEDGFPGRRLGPDNVVPHPIYGTYLIRDFLTLENKRRDGIALEDAIRVANAALARMTEEGDALIFYYDENGLLNVGARFYSGLTQARYLTAFHSLSAASGHDSYALAAKKVLHSLQIPAEAGGVLRRYAGGSVIEEFPHESPNFVLNGWTTAILEVLKYAQAAKDDEAMDFVESNMVALRALLPLYDVPEIFNTRYRLSGFMPHRLKANAPFKVIGGTVHVGNDAYPIHAQGHGAEKWANRVGKTTSHSAIVETVLGRAAWPTENSVEVEIVAEAPLRLTYERSQSRYDPFKSFPVKTGWKLTHTWELPAGRSTVSFSVPWSEAALVGYPTNFSKKIEGPDGLKHRNVYHYLHISNLDQLAVRLNDRSLIPWIEKWVGYTEEWPKLEIYRHPQIDLEPVGTFRLASI